VPVNGIGHYQTATRPVPLAGAATPSTAQGLLCHHGAVLGAVLDVAGFVSHRCVLVRARAMSPQVAAPSDRVGRLPAILVNENVQLLPAVLGGGLPIVSTGLAQVYAKHTRMAGGHGLDEAVCTTMTNATSPDPGSARRSSFSS
jgi:hypothetical protein